MDEEQMRKRAEKIDISYFDYTDQPSMLTVITGKSIETNEEKYTERLYLNPSEGHLAEVFAGVLVSKASIASRTIIVDYRLLEDDVIDVILNVYKTGRLTGLRIIPNGKMLTKDLYDKFNKPDFKDFLLSVDNISEEIDVNHTYLNLFNQKGLVRYEHAIYDQENSFSVDYDPSKDEYAKIHYDEYIMHIARELTEEELAEVAEMARNNQCQRICVDLYDPSYYKKMLRGFKKAGLPKNIEIQFLGNPLYDEVYCYEGLQDIIENRVIIHYNTCNDLNRDLSREPYTITSSPYSDIEASGKTDEENYLSMVKAIEEIVKHLESKNYSPLEKIAYVQDFFKEHYIYDPDYKTRHHVVNAKLDKIYNSDRMICEGFSNLFSAILRRAGILCFTCGTDDHQYNIVRVTDPKYGVDRLAVIDPTFNIAMVDGTNVNNFPVFLQRLSTKLYSNHPEVINVATCLLISKEDVDAELGNSNPVQATDPVGYAIRMLQLMGLSHSSNIGDPIDDDFYRNALANSGLLEDIPIDVLAQAIVEVRAKEGKVAEGHDRVIAELEVSERLLEARFAGIGYTPSIKYLEPDQYGYTQTVILTHEVTHQDQFVEIPTQATTLTRPRKQQPGETNEQYEQYLHEFYTTKFTVQHEPFTIERDPEKKKDSVVPTPEPKKDPVEPPVVPPKKVTPEPEPKKVNPVPEPPIIPTGIVLPPDEEYKSRIGQYNAMVKYINELNNELYTESAGDLSTEHLNRIIFLDNQVTSFSTQLLKIHYLIKHYEYEYLSEHHTKLPDRGVLEEIVYPANLEDAVALIDECIINAELEINNLMSQERTPEIVERIRLLRDYILAQNSKAFRLIAEQTANKTFDIVEFQERRNARRKEYIEKRGLNLS